MKKLKKVSGCTTFLGHNIVDMYRAKCDGRCPRNRRTTEQGTDNEQHHAPSIFARRFDLKRENKRVWLKGVLVEQNGKVRVVGVRKKIGRNVRDMVTGFLEDDCMEFTTGSGDNIGRISARRALIPL